MTRIQVASLTIYVFAWDESFQSTEELVAYNIKP